MFISNSREDTERMAAEFSKAISRPCLIGLIGDLGAGKTVFVKGLVRGLGGEAEEVSSPTFALLNVYKIQGGTLCHFDLYRLTTESDLLFVGFYDMLEDPRAVVVVEWIDKFVHIKNQANYIVKLEHINENTRGINVIQGGF